MRVRHLDVTMDLPQILSCMPELYESNFPDFDADASFLARKRAQLKEATRDPGQMILVAEDEMGFCGFVWLAVEVDYNGRRRGEVSAIHVLRRVRGQGVGRLLMTEAESYFRTYGCDRIFLMVTASNAAATGLYENLGYETTRYQMEKSLKR